MWFFSEKATKTKLELNNPQQHPHKCQTSALDLTAVLLQMESTLSYRAGSSRLEMFRQKTGSRHTSAAPSTGDNHIGKIKDKDNDLYAQGKQSKNMDDFGISGWPGRRNCQQQQGGWSSQVGRESKTQERGRSPKTSTGLNPPGRHIFGSFRRSAPLCYHISSGCHSTGLIWDCCFFLWE